MFFFLPSQCNIHFIKYSLRHQSISALTRYRSAYKSTALEEAAKANPPHQHTGIATNLMLFSLSFSSLSLPHSRSLPKLSSQDEEGGAAHGFGGGHTHFEPIPHDHDFCERVVINVSMNLPQQCERPFSATAATAKSG